MERAKRHAEGYCHIPTSFLNKNILSGIAAGEDVKNKTRPDCAQT